MERSRRDATLRVRVATYVGGRAHNNNYTHAICARALQLYIIDRSAIFYPRHNWPKF